MEENLIEKGLSEKKIQVKEVLNEFSSQTEPPEISLGDTSEEPNNLEKAFDITRRMAKIYSNESGGCVYAAFRREGTTKKSHLSLVVKYPNGECSEAINVDQDLIFDMTYQSNYTAASRNNWVKNSKCLELLRKYCTVDMKINYVQIYCTLREHYNEVPVIEISDCSPLSEVYERIKSYVISKRDGTNIYSTCEDYPLTMEDLKTIAMEEGYTARGLIQQMALCDVLVVDEGNKRRWQKSIRPTPKEDPIRYYIFKNANKIRNQFDRKTQRTEINPARVPCPKGVYEKWK